MPVNLKERLKVQWKSIWGISLGLFYLLDSVLLLMTWNIFLVLGAASIGITYIAVGAVKLFRNGKPFQSQFTWTTSFFTVALFVFSFWFYNQMFGTPIHFNVPDGYVGHILIFQNEGVGEKLSKEAGAYQVNVPSNGVVILDSIEPFEHMHTESASYQSGKVIPEHKQVAAPGYRQGWTSALLPSQVGFYGGGSGSESFQGSTPCRVIDYFIGTWPDYNSWFNIVSDMEMAEHQHSTRPETPLYLRYRKICSGLLDK